MGYPNTTVNFPGWPISIGGAFSMGMSPNGHAGPASYNSTTGEILSAAEFGFKYFQRLDGGRTSDGLYDLKPINQVSGPSATVVVRWYVVATGVEVANAVNLSASAAALLAFGLGL